MRMDLGVQVTKLSKQRRSTVEYLVLLCWTAKSQAAKAPTVGIVIRKEGLETGSQGKGSDAVHEILYLSGTKAST